MNEAEAIKAMQKLWGKRAAWRVNKKALNEEQKEEIKKELPNLLAAQVSAEKARDDRKSELLKDPEYVRLSEAAKQARTNREKVAGNVYHSRITIGKIENGFFLVKAQGDNFAEAIATAIRKEI